MSWHGVAENICLRLKPHILWNIPYGWIQTYHLYFYICNKFLFFAREMFVPFKLFLCGSRGVHTIKMTKSSVFHTQECIGLNLTIWFKSTNSGVRRTRVGVVQWFALQRVWGSYRAPAVPSSISCRGKNREWKCFHFAQSWFKNTPACADFNLNIWPPITIIVSSFFSFCDQFPLLSTVNV